MMEGRYLCRLSGYLLLFNQHLLQSEGYGTAPDRHRRRMNALELPLVQLHFNSPRDPVYAPDIAKLPTPERAA